MNDTEESGESQRATSCHNGQNEHTAAKSGDSGLSLSKLLTVGLIAGVGYIFVKQLPELQRYMKMRKM